MGINQRDHASGAQKRHAKAEQENEERQNDQDRGPDLVQKYLDDYGKLGDPPLNDPLSALQWVQNGMLLSLRQIMTDPFIAHEKRWRLINDMAAKVGMTHAKAHFQNRMKSVVDKLDHTRDQSGGTQSLGGIAKPTTARSRSSGRSRNPASGPGSDTPEGEE